MMGRTNRVSPEVVACMVKMRDEGMTQIEISRYTGVCQSSVQKCLARYDATGSCEWNKSPGRPRATTRRCDNLIKRIVKVNPTASSTFIKTQLPETVIVSDRTIRRRLQYEMGLRSYHPATTPKLSRKNITDRLAFANRYIDWTPDQWRKVLFSDETLIRQFYSFSTNVRRPVGKRYHARYTVPRVKQSPSQMIWGCISGSGRGGLWFLPVNSTINASIYKEILQEKVPQWMEILGCDVFQHDGAPAHKAKSTIAWFEQSGVEILGNWPGSSPDLNPIENCWAIVKKRVAEMKPTSLLDLKSKIKLVWCTEITSEYCKNLIDSMPRRLAAVLAARGGPTKY